LNTVISQKYRSEKKKAKPKAKKDKTQKGKKQKKSGPLLFWEVILNYSMKP